MTEEQVRASWGNPTETKVYMIKKGLRQRWSYGYKSKYSKPTYVYFLDGVVTGWRK